MKSKNTFSDIAKSISKGAEVTIKKSEELFSISKLMLEVSSEKAKIEEIYAKIGEKIYKRYEKGRFEDKEFEDYFKGVEKCKREIRDIKRKIDKVKNIKACVACGCEMSKGSKYCPHCGSQQ
jgi:hypothetical protein